MEGLITDLDKNNVAERVKDKIRERRGKKKKKKSRTESQEQKC